MAPLARCSLLL